MTYRRQFMGWKDADVVKQAGRFADGDTKREVGRVLRRLKPPVQIGDRPVAGNGLKKYAAFPDRLARLLKANVNLRAADPRIGPWPAAHEVPLLFATSERRANQLAVGLPAKAAYEPRAGDDAAARSGGRPPR